MRKKASYVEIRKESQKTEYQLVVYFDDFPATIGKGDSARHISAVLFPRAYHSYGLAEDNAVALTRNSPAITRVEV